MQYASSPPAVVHVDEVKLVLKHGLCSTARKALFRNRVVLDSVSVSRVKGEVRIPASGTNLREVSFLKKF
jgi:hypothetical protein